MIQINEKYTYSEKTNKKESKESPKTALLAFYKTEEKCMMKVSSKQFITKEKRKMADRLIKDFIKNVLEAKGFKVVSFSKIRILTDMLKSAGRRILISILQKSHIIEK